MIQNINYYYIFEWVVYKPKNLDPSIFTYNKSGKFSTPIAGKKLNPPQDIFKKKKFRDVFLGLTRFIVLGKNKFELFSDF